MFRVLPLLAVLLCQACGEVAQRPTAQASATPNQPTNPTASAPATQPRPVTDVYHGVSVTDPYRWLEAADDPAVARWTQLQNAYTRKVLDRLPDVPAIRARVSEVYKAAAPGYRQLSSAGGRWFVLLAAPPKQQPVVAVLPASAAASALRVLIDPNTLDADGGIAIDWFVPSPDGKRVAVSLSKHGTESGDVSIYDATTGQALPDVITRVNGGTAGGDLAWAADGSGFFYTRYPRVGERAAEDLGFYQAPPRSARSTCRVSHDHSQRRSRSPPSRT